MIDVIFDFFLTSFGSEFSRRTVECNMKCVGICVQSNDHFHWLDASETHKTQILTSNFKVL